MKGHDGALELRRRGRPWLAIMRELLNVCSIQSFEQNYPNNGD